MYANILSVCLILALLLAPAPASASHDAGNDIPPRPEYCATGRCVLGCEYHVPFVPFGAVSHNLRFCRAIRAPIQWIITK